MVKQQNTSIARGVDKTTEFASSRKSTHSKTFTSDELILSLANAYENKRAQQVSEWERVQVMRLKRAA
jgi:hypothetical protein